MESDVGVSVVWRSGKSMVITVPNHLAKMLGLRLGDQLATTVQLGKHRFVWQIHGVRKQ